jgi:hypothetical protein
MKAMPLDQLVIIITVISIFIGIWLYFFLKNKQIEQLHVERVLILSEEFTANKVQISIRKKGLNRYDFLNYNLSEALVVQPEIHI